MGDESTMLSLYFPTFRMDWLVFCQVHTMSQPQPVVIFIEQNAETKSYGGSLSQNLPPFLVVPSKEFGEFVTHSNGGSFLVLPKKPAIAA